MKVYIGTKKENSRCKYGMSIYDNDGKLIDTMVKKHDIGEKRYDNILDALRWAFAKIGVLISHGVISDNEKLFIFFDSKIVYRWFEEGYAIKDYAGAFEDVKMELDFLSCEVVLVNAKVDKNVKYESKKEEYFKVTDLYK